MIKVIIVYSLFIVIEINKILNHLNIVIQKYLSIIDSSVTVD